MAGVYPNLFSDLALGLLKASLGFFGSALDASVETYLKNCLSTADRELDEECGILLNHGDVYDDNLQAMYALWIYTKRKTGEGKPEMLRRAIRNRQVGNAIRDAANGGGCE